MLNRLGLVIHWLGFLIGAGIPGYLFFAFVLGEYYNGSKGVLMALQAYIGFHGAGWVISFILTGNKSFFPWKT